MTSWRGIPPRSWSLPDPATGAWLHALRVWAGSSGRAPRSILAGLARELFRQEGVPGDRVGLLDTAGTDGLPALPDGAGADLLGLAHEALILPTDRRARGAHYTPRPLAERLVGLCLTGLDGDPADWRVLDPACGGGAFLLAAGRALAGRGLTASEAVGTLRGVDLDPLAAEVARAATALWSGGTPAQVSVADFLVDDTGGGHDVVVGNPPFRSPLRSPATPRSARPGAYTDTAGMFLVRAVEAVRSRGRVGLIQPQSVLASRDAEGVRTAVEQRAALRCLWVAERRVFSAATHVVAVVVERDGARGPVRLFGGPAMDFRVTSSRKPTAGHSTSGHSTSWGWLAARARGLPEVDLGEGPSVDSVATATAGFRTQFYGLVDHVTDGGGGSPLVTAGLIDPLHCAWGERPARIGGRTWARPTVAVDGLEPGLAAWYAARQVPKLLVASQAKVVEVVVDEAGTLLPSVPVISVEAPAEHLWDLAAALSSPPVTAWAAARVAGTGLSADAVRLSARLLLAAPLPTDRSAWSDATGALRSAAAVTDPGSRRAALLAYGRVACRAYGVGPDLADWWCDRLPATRPT